MSKSKKTGSELSKKGINYEIELENKFIKWEKHQNEIIIRNFLQFLEAKENLLAKDILEISATRKVTPLLSGGQPKTDIIVKITQKNLKEICLNISCKNSSAKSITVHEYAAEDFIRVLDIKQQKLKNLLLKHQNDGSAKNFTDEEKELFTTYISQYKPRLYEWVLAGKHNANHPSQIANTFILNNCFHTLDELIVTLNSRKSGFGTGFAWTR